MKASLRPTFSLHRYGLLCAVVLILAWPTAALLAQQDTGEQTDGGIQAGTLRQTLEREFTEFSVGLAHFATLIQGEFNQVKGPYVIDWVESISNRYHSDLTGRILWSLVAVLTASGSLFMILTAHGLLSRLRNPPARVKGKTSRKDSSRRKSAAGASGQSVKMQDRNKRVPKSVVGMLRAGLLDEVEALLLEERRIRPADSNVVMYLLACRAAKDDADSYDQLLSEIFPEGLDRKVQICLHAAQIGRILSPSAYPTNRFPEPDKPFEVDAAMSSESLGTVSEFGDVHTLLDLVRVYLDMEEEAETKHMIVEILVRGDREQRIKAVEFLKRMREKTSAS